MIIILLKCTTLNIPFLEVYEIQENKILNKIYEIIGLNDVVNIKKAEENIYM